MLCKFCLELTRLITLSLAFKDKKVKPVGVSEKVDSKNLWQSTHLREGGEGRDRDAIATPTKFDSFDTLSFQTKESGYLLFLFFSFTYLHRMVHYFVILNLTNRKRKKMPNLSDSHNLTTRWIILPLLVATHWLKVR